ncbi:MAG: dTMP kinase [Paenibacillaceae bacterium]
MRGYWISFEGLDGSGKTNQVQRLFEWLASKNVPTLITAEPGGTNTGQLLRTLLKSKQDPEIELITELLLFQAARHESMKKIVIPSLNSGKVVISDRGMDSTTAYQGYGRGLNTGWINNLTEVVNDRYKPDLTILLDIDPDIAINRIVKREIIEEDQFDVQELDFRRRVRQGFICISNQEPGRVKILDGSLPEDELHRIIVNIVREFI